MPTLSFGVGGGGGGGGAFAGGGGVGNFVDLEPVDTALVGEDQHVGVGRGDEEVLDKVFRARAHADPSLAAARLPARRLCAAGEVTHRPTGDADTAGQASMPASTA